MEYAYELCLFERLHFFNLKAQYSVLHSFAALGVAHVRDCLITCCSSQTANYGTITLRGFINAKVESCSWQDVGDLNGLSYDGAILSGNVSWLALVGISAVAGDYAQASVENCYFDENCKANVLIIGEVGNPLKLVRLSELFINPAAQPGFTACVNASYVQTLSARGLVNSDLAGTGSTAKYVQLANVTRADLAYVRMRAGGLSNIVATDANTTALSIEDADAGILANLASLAAQTLWRGTINANDLNALSDVRSSGAALAANTLVKPSGAGFVNVATTDDAGACAGVTLDAAAGAAANVRVARIGQPVVVLNDGAAVISIGDRIIPSTATAGEVTHSAVASTATVGIALTAAAAVAGTPFQIAFQPGAV